MPTSRIIITVCSLLLTGAGCEGAIGLYGSEPAPAEAIRDPPEVEKPTPVEGPRAVEPGSPQAQAPYLLRRLTPQEYLLSSQRLLELQEPLALEVVFPSDLSHSGFDNDASGQRVTAAHLEAWSRAAASITAAAFARTDWLESIEQRCAPDAVDSRNCLEGYLRSLTERAWRRAPSPEGLAPYFALVDAEGAKGVEALTLVTEAVLQSPSFLYRVEQGQQAHEEFAALRDEELVARLAFLLWGRGPDLDLLTRAGGELDGAALREVVAAMWAHEDARRQRRHFLMQMYHLEALREMERSETLFPEFDGAAVEAMIEEALRVAENHLDPQRTFLELYTTRQGYWHEELSAWYGGRPAGTTPDSDGFAPASWELSSQRAGLLGLPAILALTGRSAGTSAISRGQFVREVLLCQRLPDPPAFVPELPEVQEGWSERERLEQHRSNEACAGCHQLLDPLGFGFEHFDAVGKERQRDALGAAIDATGHFVGASPADFRGTRELAKILHKHPEVPRCVAQRYLSFAFGRPVHATDDELVEAMARALEAPGGTFLDMVLTLIESRSFRTVRVVERR